MDNIQDKSAESEQLRIQQLNLLYEHLPPTLASTIIASILISLITYKAVVPFYLLLWLLIHLFITATRYFIARRYPQDRISYRDTGKWLNLYIIGTFLTGMTWGLFPYLVDTSVTLYYFFLSALWVCGLTSAALAHQAVLKRIFFSYSAPAILPVAILLLVSGNSDYYLLALGLAFFYCFLMMNLFRINKAYTDSIKLQYNNNQLVESLNEEKDRVNALNQELRLDIRGRIEIEEELREEKDKVEDLAKKLLMISTQDGLTGISNRRHFDEFLANEWGRAARSSSPISLILCDIDNFKAYNDHYGHQKGDKCLCRIASILSDCARRGGDLAARYGGEEFAIILSDTNIADALLVARQLHAGICEQAIPHAASDVDNIVTASFGVATIVPNKDIPSSQLISIADKALYKAKQSGRNQVVSSELTAVDNNMKSA